MFDPVTDMNAIDGAIADLAARNDRPQGYPFSKITLYSVCPQIAGFMPHLNYVSASEVPSMRRLDFKKAGRVFGNKVQEMKNDLSQVSEEYIITAQRFDSVDDLQKKTTGCRKYMIEVECNDQEDRWLAIQFRKAIKEYITETLAINIVPAIFTDTMTSDEEYKATGEMWKDTAPCVARVIVTLGNCSECLYQALEEYGVDEFAEYPIRLHIPSRQHICDNLGDHFVSFGEETASFYVEIPQ